MAELTCLQSRIIQEEIPSETQNRFAVQAAILCELLLECSDVQVDFIEARVMQFLASGPERRITRVEDSGIAIVGVCTQRKSKRRMMVLAACLGTLLHLHYPEHLLGNANCWMHHDDYSRGGWFEGVPTTHQRAVVFEVVQTYYVVGYQGSYIPRLYRAFPPTQH